MRFLLFFVSFLAQFPAISQNFGSPLDIPLEIVGSFGELRPNHFHMGIDFRTQSKEGLALYSVADGYVAKIKINSGGYGKIIYVNHPNGLTSVYAHCQNMYGKIQKYLENEQIIQEKNEIEVVFKPTDLPVKKGDTIAISGNTGGSTGPHLHFEIRRTATDVAINPLIYGFEVKDFIAPSASQIKVYSLTKEGYMIPGKSSSMSIKTTKTGLFPEKPLWRLPASFCTSNGGIGFSIGTKDKISGTPNNCGTYGIGLSIGENELFNLKTDSVAFESTHHINDHKDYAAYQNNRSHLHKCFKVDGNDLTFYAQKNGIVRASPMDTLNLSFRLTDIAKNETSMKFKVAIDSGAIDETNPFLPLNNFIFPDSSYFFSSLTERITIKKGSVFQPVQRYLSFGNLHIGDETKPTRLNIGIEIMANKTIPASKQIVCIQRNGGNFKALSSKISGDWIIASSRYFGTFALKIDTVSPIIKSLSFKKTDTAFYQTTLFFSVSDWLSDVADYKFFLDNKFVPAYLDGKNDKIVVPIRNLTEEKHIIKFQVTDACGNTSTFEQILSYSKTKPIAKKLKKKQTKAKSKGKKISQSNKKQR